MVSEFRLKYLSNIFTFPYLSLELKRVASLAPVCCSWTVWIPYIQWQQVTSHSRQKVTFLSFFVLFSRRYRNLQGSVWCLRVLFCSYKHSSCTQHVDNLVSTFLLSKMEDSLCCSVAGIVTCKVQSDVSVIFLFFVLIRTLLAPNTLTALSPGSSLSKMEDRKLEKSHCHATRLSVTLVNNFFSSAGLCSVKERYQGEVCASWKV